MSVADLQQAVTAGGKFVRFQFCISVLVMSFKRSSPIIFLQPHESAWLKGLSYSLISLIAGWWGIPWGPIWTLTTIAENLSGGKDLTPQVLAALGATISRSGSPPPGPVSPTEAAEHAEREARKTLVQRIAFGVLAILLLVGAYGIYKTVQTGRAAPTQPGKAEFSSANNELFSDKSVASGNSDQARQLAAGMSKLMQTDREKNFSQAAKKSVMDERDQFRTYCYLQDDRCVFLIHVPELRRFNVEAKQSLADASWLFAQGLLGKRAKPLRVAVALRGIVAYDRMLWGESSTAHGNGLNLTPNRFDGFSCEKQLIPWFAPELGAQNQATR